MKEKFLSFDWIGFAAMAALVAVGTLAIHSAGAARTAYFHGAWIENLATAGFGLVLYLALAFTDYRRYLDFVSAPAYFASILFLVLVLAFGSEVLGAKRWLWFFQPSEVAKLCVIIMAASVFGQDGAWGLGKVRGFGGFALAGVLFALPAVLILAEPDLGTTLALVPAAVAMLYAARVWRRGLVSLLAVGGMAALAILGAVHEAEKPGVAPERRDRIMKWVPLRPHQVRRVKTFLFPESNADGAGWNLKQAKIAIGSGGWRGKGLGKGDQSQLKYLPPAGVMNDFIFCVWAEETGFRGTLLLVFLYGVLFMSGCRAAYFATDGRGRLLAIGVTTLLFAHVYINIGMSIGMLPITGLPLPFISSGRTFLVTVMCGLGFVQIVTIHRKELN